ncbi:GSCFA domain-containing protein [Methylocystis rosea]|uniref:GSCFA domain-containing protein n=2 Tax=Methylocystis rosea TaxID=173366 RepID=A0ABX6EQH1_9HYPH|nr:GSCFA domain-containing protein [Methylocystis rosea]
MRFEQASPESLQCARLDNGAYNDLRALVKSEIAGDRAQPVSPYTGLADYQFWRRAIERTPQEKVDPVVSGKFKITKAERIATAGSCFAQHISRTLGSSGFNYYIAESAPEGMSAEDGLSRNFGIFSARFGNIYTARQLVQLFDRAYGRFCPMDTEWMRTDGRWADPFRPTVEPDGFLSEADVERSREAHLSCVRSMFESLHVFIFTLGLTEGWRAKHDGAVFPLAPGVAAGCMDFERYEFINFGVKDIVDDLNSFIRQLRTVNPGAKVILTVSPVPLIATYEDRHVLVSTTYSKSTLRVAAEEVASHHHDVAYFPSYEVITGAFNRGAYFEADLRSIRSDGVEHVMALFLRHYTNTVTAIRKPESSSIGAWMEAEEAQKVVCDEILMDT